MDSRFIQWSPNDPSMQRLRAKLHRRLRWWMFSRLANAGRLQIGRLILMWPMPWAEAFRRSADPTTAHVVRTRPSGILNFFGWYDRKVAPRG